MKSDYAGWLERSFSLMRPKRQIRWAMSNSSRGVCSGPIDGAQRSSSICDRENTRINTVDKDAMHCAMRMLAYTIWMLVLRVGRGSKHHSYRVSQRKRGTAAFRMQDSHGSAEQQPNKIKKQGARARSCRCSELRVRVHAQWMRLSGW